MTLAALGDGWLHEGVRPSSARPDKVGAHDGWHNLQESDAEAEEIRLRMEMDARILMLSESAKARLERDQLVHMHEDGPFPTSTDGVATPDTRRRASIHCPPVYVACLPPSFAQTRAPRRRIVTDHKWRCPTHHIGHCLTHFTEHTVTGGKWRCRTHHTGHCLTHFTEHIVTGGKWGCRTHHTGHCVTHVTERVVTDHKWRCRTHLTGHSDIQAQGTFTYLMALPPLPTTAPGPEAESAARAAPAAQDASQVSSSFQPMTQTGAYVPLHQPPRSLQAILTYELQQHQKQQRQQLLQPMSNRKLDAKEFVHAAPPGTHKSELLQAKGLLFPLNS
eukprot:scaffold101138_cov20-Tisochrysis_lutea.AAC.1